MPYDPVTGGYGNSPSIGYETREQWIQGVATSMIMEFANADGTRATSRMMDATLWQRAGIPMPPQEYIGFSANGHNPGGQLPPIVWDSMQRMAQWLADHPDEAGAASLPPIPTLSDPRSVASPADQANRAQSAENDRQRAADAALQNSTNATSIANTNTNAATSRYATDQQFASSAADRAQQALQFNRTAGQRDREFDLNLAEDRRQFNATMMTNLLQMGITLAQHPVDWIGYQFYMANLSIPMTALNAATMAQISGAVPPSGPSEVGPMTGGPAALDGDMELAQAAGVQGGLVPLEDAVQQNPGNGGNSEVLQGLTSANMVNQWAQAAGGMAALTGKLNQERMTTLPAIIGNTPALQGMLQQLQQQAPAQPPAPPMAPPSSPPPALGPETYGGPPTIPGAMIGALPVGGPGTPTPWGANTPTPGGAFGAPAQPPPMTTMPMVPTTPGVDPGFHGQPNVNDGNTTGQHTGVYVGSTATPAAPTGAFGAPASTTTGTGVHNPQGEAMLQAIATQLGVPIEQVRQLVPVNLLAGGYSRETIMNSPALQSLQNQTAMSQFRTAPANDSRFGTIQAFGIPTGIRGGQDINLRSFMLSPQSGQEMMQGAMNATGQYWPDVQHAMLKASPATQYQQGSFGTRRLWGN